MKVQDHMASQVNSTYRLRGEQKHILFKCFQKITDEDK